jgi:hypothetical protein
MLGLNLLTYKACVCVYVATARGDQCLCLIASVCINGTQITSSQRKTLDQDIVAEFDYPRGPTGRADLIYLANEA